MALSTFTLFIDADVFGDPTVKTAEITILVQNAEVITDPGGDTFHVPPKPFGAALPYSINLPTDVSTGESTEIGYDITVHCVGRAVRVLFAAQAAGSSKNLAGLNAVILPPPVGGADASGVAADLADLVAVVNSKADESEITGKQDTAAAAGVRTWNGSTWSARPTGYAYVECFSDGTYNSVRDPSAPSPTSAVDGDRWWAAVS